MVVTGPSIQPVSIKNSQYYAFVSQLVGSTYAAVGNLIYFFIIVIENWKLNLITTCNSSAVNYQLLIPSL